MANPSCPSTKPTPELKCPELRRWVPMAESPQSPAPESPRKGAPRLALIEPVALVLLSLATVGTAWCSYQAAVWGGLSQRYVNQSAAASRRAAISQLRAHQMVLLDVVLFSQHINARANSNETLARFYSDRFRD